MVIYANQSLRVAHEAMSRVLKEINQTNSLVDVKEKMSSMEEIFHLQEMFNIKKEEKDIEKELKRLGYLNEK
jgi:2-methylisocitrate lyase-like PEP mutase family enzyme